MQPTQIQLLDEPQALLELHNVTQHSAFTIDLGPHAPQGATGAILSVQLIATSAVWGGALGNPNYVTLYSPHGDYYPLSLSVSHGDMPVAQQCMVALTDGIVGGSVTFGGGAESLDVTVWLLGWLR